MYISQYDFRMNKQLDVKMNWNDTFVSFDHLKSCFPEDKVVLLTKSNSPPFRFELGLS